MSALNDVETLKDIIKSVTLSALKDGGFYSTQKIVDALNNIDDYEFKYIRGYWGSITVGYIRYKDANKSIIDTKFEIVLKYSKNNSLWNIDVSIRL